MQPDLELGFGAGASKESYYDDPEFENFSTKLADEIFELAAANGRLRLYLRTTSHPGHSAAERAADSRREFRRVSGDIERLRSWPDLAASQKFTQDKLVREFGSALAEFQQIQREVADVERAEARAVSVPDLEPELSSGIELTSVKSQAVVFEERLAADEVAFQRGLIEEREREINTIEQGITELNELFTGLGTVVAEQGTALDAIDANIYSVAQATRDGSAQLTSAARWQRRSSGRTMCFLLILIVLALIVMVSASMG